MEVERTKFRPMSSKGSAAFTMKHALFGNAEKMEPEPENFMKMESAAAHCKASRFVGLQCAASRASTGQLGEAPETGVPFRAIRSEQI
jgi:hypothetical protein